MWYHNLLQLLLFTELCFAQPQSSSAFPNPRTNGYIVCGLKSRGYVCDPEKQLTEQERYRLNNDLLVLSRRTSHSGSVDFCSTKGADATLFITTQSSEHLAHQLKSRWAIDGQCKKSVVFVLSTTDRRLYYATDENFPISVNTLEKVISEQQQLLNEGKYTMALTAIFTKAGGSVQDSSNQGINMNDITRGRRISMGGASQVCVLPYFMIIAPIVLYLFIFV